MSVRLAWVPVALPGRERAAAADTGATKPTDDELLRLIGRDDEAALVALYDRYAGYVCAVALRVLGDRELAEEVVQDTFLRCWHGVETYHPGRGRVVGWLVGIARNRAIDALRSRSHQARLREGAELADRPPSGGTGEPTATDLVLLRAEVAEALAALPVGQRQIIELAYYGGLSQSEIARALGEPLGTVKTRTRAAMDRLRLLLRPGETLAEESAR
jgi:RNA polymerase sigma-70 factor (ECF subfamily)